jgi:hypothetical protein
VRAGGDVGGRKPRSSLRWCVSFDSCASSRSRWCDDHLVTIRGGDGGGLFRFCERRQCVDHDVAVRRTELSGPNLSVRYSRAATVVRPMMTCAASLCEESQDVGDMLGVYVPAWLRASHERRGPFEVSRNCCIHCLEFVSLGMVMLVCRSWQLFCLAFARKLGKIDLL